MSANDDLPPLPEPAHWYCVSKDGLATLCVDEADAQKEAAYGNESWPLHAPYRAVQLVTADQLRAAVLAERLATLEAVNALIKDGPLKGNGYDDLAQNNGVILAANLLASRVYAIRKGAS